MTPAERAGLTEAGYRKSKFGTRANLNMSRAAIVFIVLAAPLAVALLVGCESAPEHLTPAERGKREFHSGHWNEAIEACNEAIAAHPMEWEPYVYRGRAYMALDDANRAIADYNRAIDLAPKASEAYYNRAIAYGELAKKAIDATARAKFEKQAAADQLAGDKLDPAYQNRVDQITRLQVLEDQRATAEATRVRKEREEAKKKADQEALVKGDDDRRDVGAFRRRRGDDTRADARDESRGPRERGQEQTPVRSSRDRSQPEEQTRFYRDAYGLPVELGANSDRATAGDRATDQPGSALPYGSSTAPRRTEATPDLGTAARRRAPTRQRPATGQEGATGAEQQEPFGQFGGAVPLTPADEGVRRSAPAPQRAPATNPFDTGSQNPFAPRSPFAPTSQFEARPNTPFSGGGATPFSNPAQPQTSSSTGRSGASRGGAAIPATPFSGQPTTPFTQPAANPFSAPAATPFSPAQPTPAGNPFGN